MKQIIYVYIFMILVPLVFASPNLYYEKDQTGNISFVCKIQKTGMLCDSSFMCNLTYLMNPEKNLITENDPFLNNNPIYTYNLTSNQVDMHGDYYGEIYCTNGSVGNTLPINYRVNNSGQPDNENNMIGIFIAIGLMCAIYIYAAFKVNNENDWARTVLFIGTFFNLMGALMAALLTQTQMFELKIVIEGLLLVNSLVIGFMVYMYVMYFIKQAASKDE